MSVIEAMARAAIEQESHDWRCRSGEPRIKRLRYDIFRASSAEKQVLAALAEARRLGWQLVPAEPNETMLRRSTTPDEYCPACGYDALWAGTDGAEAKSLPAEPWPKQQAEARENIAKIYRAMLAAAPSVEDA